MFGEYDYNSIYSAVTKLTKFSGFDDVVNDIIKDNNDKLKRLAGEVKIKFSNIGNDNINVFIQNITRLEEILGIDKLEYTVTCTWDYPHYDFPNDLPKMQLVRVFFNNINMIPKDYIDKGIISCNEIINSEFVHINSLCGENYIGAQVEYYVVGGGIVNINENSDFKKLTKLRVDMHKFKYANKVTLSQDDIDIIDNCCKKCGKNMRDIFDDVGELSFDI